MCKISQKSWRDVYFYIKGRLHEISQDSRGFKVGQVILCIRFDAYNWFLM